MLERTACFLLIGEAASPDIADRVALRYRDCPYVHFISAFGPMLVGVWYLPEQRWWWLRWVAEEPLSTLGLHRAAAYQTERPTHPAAFVPRVRDERRDVAPCGSICSDCERGDACCRCPATNDYDSGRER